MLCIDFVAWRVYNVAATVQYMWFLVNGVADLWCRVLGVREICACS